MGAALALRPGLLRDALTAGLERAGVEVVGSCLPRPSSVGPVLAAGPAALLLAVLHEDDLAPHRAGGCLSPAAAAGVGVVAVVPARDHPLAAALQARGAYAAVGQDDPLDLLVDRVREAAGCAGAGRAAQHDAADAAAAAAAGTTAGGPRADGTARPALSVQEERTLVLYVSGLKLAAVARRLGVRYDTAKGYLDRVRAKYAAAGRPARTKTELYRAALEDGRLG